MRRIWGTAVLLACGSAGGGGEAAEPAAEDSAPAAVYEPTVHFPGGDPGMGLVWLDVSGLAEGEDESVEIRSAPDGAAPVMARFSALLEAGSVRYVVVGDVAEANLLEFTYEESGIPYDSVRADGWVRVLPGLDAGGSAVRGWVRPDGTKVQRLAWREWLATRATFFVEDGAIDLRATPGGPRVEFRLADGGDGYPSRFDYHLEADSAVGEWVRVRVVTPSDACGEAPAGVRDTVAWTRLVDDGGRPLVWYFARGC